MWLEESERGLGGGVREEVRRVMGGKVMWSLKVHFKNFDFELKAIKTQDTAVFQEAMTERINNFHLLMSMAGQRTLPFVSYVLIIGEGLV